MITASVMKELISGNFAILIIMVSPTKAKTPSLVIDFQVVLEGVCKFFLKRFKTLDKYDLFDSLTIY